MDKPKIAILTIRNSYEFGGVLTSVKRLYKFCQQYFDPTIFYLSFDPKISANIKKFNLKNQIRHTKYFGMDAVEIGSRWAFWEPGHYVYSLPLWKEALKDYDYFIFKSGSCISAYPLALLDKKFAMWIGTAYEDDRLERVKALSPQRKFIDFFAQFKMKKIEREVLQKANYVWSISKITRKRIDQILGYRRSNLAVCGFPMNINVSKKTMSENKNIIAVGRFSDPRKNFNMLMRSFELIYEKNKDTKLYIVGSKPNLNQISEFTSLEYFKNVIFTGRLNEKELKQFYEISDLMLITSYQEGLGIIGLEAMSYGIPVIATKCGGTEDYVVHSKNGYLVDINDHQKMAEFSLDIINSEKSWNDFSRYALEFVKDNFSEKKFESIIKYGLIQTYPELKKYFQSFEAKISLNIDNKIEQKLV